jgi:hypothetical protein
MTEEVPVTHLEHIQYHIFVESCKHCTGEVSKTFVEPIDEDHIVRGVE